MEWTCCDPESQIWKTLDVEEEFKILKKQAFYSLPKTIENGVLYIPVKPNFVAVDMFVKVGNQLFGFQVTTRSSHDNTQKNYLSFLKDVETLLGGENLELVIYFVPNPKHAEEFAQSQKKKLLKLKSDTEIVGKLKALEFRVMVPKSRTYLPSVTREFLKST